MVRVIRNAQNRVEADPTGKKAGRGAYLCQMRECWDAVLTNRGRLEQALKLETPMDPEDFARLREFAATLPRRGDPAAEPNKTE